VPWAKAVLRGQRVLARVKEDGTFAAEGGRVEIRYKPNDGRAYQAGARNLELVAGEPLLPDDACVPGEKVASKEERKAERSATKKEKAAANIAPVPKDAWTVYADGACSGNPGPAGLGIVLVAPGGKIAEGFEYLGTATNNIAELTAILRAAQYLPAAATAVLHTDSQYSIGVLTKGWKAKANVALIEQVRASLKPFTDLELIYVRGHSGVVLNERADALAVQAVKTRQTSPWVTY
jgi:ribonuclease HI